jgi:hydroxyacylglutathione hydrolase
VLDEAVVQLLRIGYDEITGVLAGGPRSWEASGRTVAAYPVADLDEFCRAWKEGVAGRVLDVRQRTEWDEGHIEPSRHLFVGDLPGRIAEVDPGEETWVICRTGHRASIAASLLDREGIAVRLVASYGVPRFLSRCLGGLP